MTSMQRAALAALTLGLSVGARAADLVWYADAPAAGLQDWSWTTHDFNNASPVHAGTRSISMNASGWGGVYLVDEGGTHQFTDYQSLNFWIHGGTTGAQQLNVQFMYKGLAVGQFSVPTYTTGGAIAANAWRQVSVPFNATTTMTHGAFDGLIVMAGTGGNQATLYLDDVVFVQRATALPTGSLTASVDFDGARRAINPEVYGVNFPEDTQHADLRYPLVRSGGNSTTRFNWQSDSHNTAFDYFYQNIADGSGSGLPANNGANRFIDAARLHGGQALVTVTTIGWRPLADRVKRWGFSIQKYGPQDSNECAIYNPPPSWCSADAGNGECQNVVNNTGFCVNGKIVNNDPTDTSIATTPSWTTGWINHLVGRYGLANNGGVRYYALDNEAMLWNSTHRDVHPTPPTYDEVWTRGRDHALAIKAVDPGAKVFGPVTWGWCDLFTSAADAAVGPSCITGADRDAHGGLAFAEWYLKQVCDYQTANGIRVVDYFDAHYYPQGNVDGLGGGSSELPDDAARRLRSLRELYDPNYVSESWVGADGSKPQLIPRLRAWVAARCPGTKLALTEYKWGPDNGATGALAQAEALAIFGREGLDAATRWVAPDVGSLAERAFRMYLDYDGANTRVVGDALTTTVSNGTELGLYAVEDTAHNRNFVMIFNRATAPRDITVTFSQALNGAYQVYRFDAGHDWAAQTPGTINGSSFSLSAVPGRSATLVVLPARGNVGPADAVFANGFE